MEPAIGVQVIQTPLSHFWIVENILYLVAHDVERTPERGVEHFRIIREHLKGAKKHFIIDLNHLCTDFGREVRQLLVDEYPNIAHSVALIARTSCELVIAHFFKRIESDTLPVQVFYSAAQARRWAESLLMS